MNHHLSIVTKAVGEVGKEHHNHAKLAFKSTHPPIGKFEVCATISVAIEPYSELRRQE
jgi:hypothetical protein